MQLLTEPYRAQLNPAVRMADRPLPESRRRGCLSHPLSEAGIRGSGVMVAASSEVGARMPVLLQTA